MTPEEIEYRNKLAPILDQLESLSDQDREDTINALDPTRRQIVKDLLFERACLKGIARNLSGTTTDTGDPITKIAFGAPDDPDGYVIDLTTQEYAPNEAAAAKPSAPVMPAQLINPPNVTLMSTSHDFYAVYENGILIEQADHDYLNLETAGRMYTRQGATVQTLQVPDDVYEQELNGAGFPRELADFPTDRCEDLNWNSYG